MGKLIFVRHGESVANERKEFAEEHTPLTDLGREQAAATGKDIAARFQPAAVVSSALARARQTAEIIAAELGLPVEIWPGLEEQDFGEFKGKPFTAYREYYAQNVETYPHAAPWMWVPPGGESTAQLQQRVLATLDQLRERHPNDEVVVVCHGMVMMSLAAHWSGTWEGAEVPPNCAVIEG